MHNCPGLQANGRSVASAGHGSATYSPAPTPRNSHQKKCYGVSKQSSAPHCAAQATGEQGHDNQPSSPAYVNCTPQVTCRAPRPVGVPFTTSCQVGRKNKTTGTAVLSSWALLVLNNVATQRKFRFGCPDGAAASHAPTYVYVPYYCVPPPGTKLGDGRLSPICSKGGP